MPTVSGQWPVPCRLIGDSPAVTSDDEEDEDGRTAKASARLLTVSDSESI